MEDFKSIIVSSSKKQVTVVENPTSYPLIGKGKQGAVFKISSDRCVKIFADQQRCLDEANALKAAQEGHIVPNLFDVGSNYIVMEYIDGTTLDEFLESKGFIPEMITEKIISLLKEMKRMKFTRLDAKLRHIFVTKEEDLIVIDHANSFIKMDNTPTELIKDLNELGLFSAFLEQVQQIDSDFYMEWKEFLGKKHKKKNKKKKN